MTGGPVEPGPSGPSDSRSSRPTCRPRPSGRIGADERLRPGDRAPDRPPAGARAPPDLPRTGSASPRSSRPQLDHARPARVHGPRAEGRGRPIALPDRRSAGAIIAIIVQPTVGSISDYTISRWGRRKPYIFIGSILDVVFLVGIANSNTLLAIAAFIALLQFSSNFAQGPFQGYVPDLVPAAQVGLASALVGLMQILGNVAGFVIGGIADGHEQLRPRADRARRARARDDAVRRHPRARRADGEVARRPLLVLDRGRGVGHRRPARAQLPVAGRARDWPSSWPARMLTQLATLYLTRSLGSGSRQRRVS